MLGPIINILNRTGKLISNLKTHTELEGSVPYYGPGNAINQNVTLAEHTTLSSLADQYNSLDFTNLTVSAPLIFDSASYNNGDSRAISFSDTYPLILRCSDTLKINSTGYISANGQGGVGNGGYSGQQGYRCPMYIEDVVRADRGFSLSHDAYGRLHQYGSVGGFLEPRSLICGARGGWYRYYDYGGWITRYDSDDYPSISLISGGNPGSDPDHYAGLRHRTGGSSGGSIFLYFDHLIIDGLEYGVDPLCNISVIQANGAFPREGFNGCTKGGGMIVIAAKTINITTRQGENLLDTGSIMSNAVLSPNDSITADIKQWRWSVLNNLPQLAFGQTGWVIQGKDVDSNGIYHTINSTYEMMTTSLLYYRESTIQTNPSTGERTVVDVYDDGQDGRPNIPQRLYFYDDGLGNYRALDTSTPYSRELGDTSSHNTWAGGAGIVLGFKL